MEEVEESGDRVGQAKEIGRNVARNSWSILKRETRFVLGAFFRPFFRVLLVAGLLIFLLVMGAYVHSVVSNPQRSDQLQHVLSPVVALVYAVLWAGQLALVVATFWASWKLAGPWIVVPLITIPISLAIAFWLMSGLLEAAGAGVVAAMVQAGAEHEWEVGALGPAARIGPLILIIAIPLLLYDLGAILLDLNVLWNLLLLLLAFVGTLGLGLIPSSAVSIVAILYGFVRRFLERHGETLKNIHRS